MPGNIEPSIDETIAAAVQARVEASVVTALSSDDTFGRMVAAAMQQPVIVRRGYREEKEPYIHHVLHEALKQAVKAAVDRYVVEEQEALEAAVATALRKQTKDIAAALVTKLSDSAGRMYGLNLDIDLKVRHEDA